MKIWWGMFMTTKLTTILTTNAPILDGFRRENASIFTSAKYLKTAKNPVSTGF